MSDTLNSTASEPEFHRLRDAYDQAFRQLAHAVQHHAGVTEAQREYHERRDSLAQSLIGTDRFQQRRSAVERLAYALWQQAGCPAGTAESDWYRAEALVMRPVAA